ncbi:MAG TPA: 2-oxoacid:acceptor oxidoreductase family protein [Polyangiaceae bacterium]|jgi:2-oxoglutarate ferredoxin oxidoreductase subunit gamma|nr:MAG: NADH-dependent phenylglyoxylate dehydrogenase subunit gamma [Deltaproteobacteria bacterium ADurb.Bin207]HNS99406.1 2-oxoacid:acceptor oxidoreductase family protein [Polyangiaceae bacterium]HNZ24600.1 2-oxoacid:acceptor oxidoreductase family protein [Polyangiaceae bacterium]HOD23614.1 2-oxoacid:acceptor oxidoreductase family protein [Polyangiaceae bacterium]HOE50280.1 2-oxoacid:acceptor oxidoreductase family protein [Polyangiaceae bacterium]
MQNEVMFAGFGGQGIMLIGQMLAYAGMGEGKNVVWIPSYGPEMRGGTAYCTVVVSDKDIGSPIIDRPESIAVLNRPSLDKFHTRVRGNGLLIINTSLIDATTDRSDIDVLNVPANQIAMEAGTGKAANMCVLGAYVGRTKAVTLESLRGLVRYQFKSKPQFIDVNLRVLEKGYELGEQLATKNN